MTQIYDEATIKIPLTVRYGRDDGFSYITNEPLGPMNCTGIFATITKAKKRLKAEAVTELQEALRHKARSQRRLIIGTNSGAVFIVRFHDDSWGYDIAGPNRHGTFGHILMSKASFEDACDEARKHLEQAAFGGIAWETR